MRVGAEPRTLTHAPELHHTRIDIDKALNDGRSSLSGPVLILKARQREAIIGNHGFRAHDRDCLPIVRSLGLVRLEQRPSAKRQYPRSLPCQVVDAAQANPDGEDLTRS